MSWKARIYQILEKAEDGDRFSRTVDLMLIALIFLNILAVILETVASLEEQFGAFFAWFEWFSIIVFSIEYLLRVWSCTEDPYYKDPVKGRLKYIFSFMSLIDLVSLLPFFLPRLINLDGRFLRSLRLLRLFRLLKFTRYSKAMKIISKVLRSRREELTISMAIAGILLVTVSCLMYFVEHTEQPEAFSSIPATMWWGVATLTTVGYGDIYPITVLGKILGGIMAVLGVGIFALPAGILATGFNEVLGDKEDDIK